MRVPENMMRKLKFLLAPVLAFTLIATACSTSWVTQAEAIVQVLIPAAVNIITLITALGGKTISPADVTAAQALGKQVETDLSTIGNLIDQYNKASATAQPGILNDLQTAITIAQNDMATIFTVLHVKDAATAAKIDAVVGVVLSELQSIQALVPLVKSGSDLKKVRAAMTSPPLDANDFAGAYNKCMTAKSPNPDVTAAASKLKVHYHNRFVRTLSFGTAN